MNDYYGEDVALKDQLPMIRGIIFRDVYSARWGLVVTMVFSIILYVMLSSLLSTNPPNHASWNQGNIMGIYGIAIMINIAAFLSSFYQFYSLEVRRGTIRSLSLYPLNMNGITTAKLISSTIVSITAGSVVYWSIFGPFVWYGMYGFGGILLIQMTTIGCSMFVLTVAGFASHIFIRLFNSLKISGSGLNMLLFVFAFLFTETMMRVMGSFFSVFDEDLTREEINDTARAFSQWSVFHSGGRWIAMVLTDSGLGLDLHFILPLGIVVIVIGYLLGSKIYLDVFIRD